VKKNPLSGRIMKVADIVNLAGVATKAKKISHRNQSLLLHLPE
jgi:hypothetical protein